MSTTPLFVAPVVNPDGSVTPSPVEQYVAAFPDAPSTPGHLAALAAQQAAAAQQVTPPPVVTGASTAAPVACGHDGTAHWWQPGCPGYPGTAAVEAPTPYVHIGALAPVEQAPPAPAPVTFATLPVEVERHKGDGRPKILPAPDVMQAYHDALAKHAAEVALAKAEGREAPAAPVEPKPRYYTRASSFGDCLEDTYNLERWKQRMVLLGVLESPDMLMSAAAFREDKNKLNEVVERALTLAKGDERAQLGTALHKVFETMDLGRDPGTVPERFVADLAAYRTATAGWQYLGAETFVVCDELGLDVAGTFDRLRLVPPPPRSRRKRPVARIVDIKTGGSVDFSWLKFAVQLAVYAHGQRYDAATGARSPLGVLPDGTEVDVDLKVAEVVWVPAGEGRAEVFELNIEQGWTAAQIAKSVRGLRKDAKTWATPAGKGEASLEDLVLSAPSVEALTALFTERAAEFTPEVQELATARWAVLSAGAA